MQISAIILITITKLCIYFALNCVYLSAPTSANKTHESGADGAPASHVLSVFGATVKVDAFDWLLLASVLLSGAIEYLAHFFLSKPNTIILSSLFFAILSIISTIIGKFMRN